MAAKRLNLSTFCSALLALGGVGVLEFSSGPVEATIGDLICMASPILIGLSRHLSPGFGSQDLAQYLLVTIEYHHRT